MPITALLALAFAAAPARPAAAPAPMLARFNGVALDPAGGRIADVESLQARGRPTPEHGAVVVRDTAGTINGRYDPCGRCSYGAPAWSPDGARLAFVASGGGSATLYVLEGGRTRALTSVKGLAATPRWSADGHMIAFLATENATKETGAVQPGVRQVGVIGEKEDAKRIAIVPAAGGAYRLVSPEGTFVYEYDWLPDGSGFVGTAAEGNGDNQWWVASLRRFAIGGQMSVLAAPAMQMNQPRVSPDGRTVAFIGGLMSDFGSVGGDVYTVAVAGGTPVDATPGAKLTFTSLAWRGPHLIAGVTQGGGKGTALVDPVHRTVGEVAVRPETIVAGDGAVALDRTGMRAAFAAESFTAAPHLSFGPLGQARPITHDNDGRASNVAPRDIRWRNGGFDVQGWLLEPTGGAAIAGARKPMITIVHGGPSSAITPRFPWGDEIALLAEHGYWVFQANPRGSYGQGEAFTRANVKDFGGGDLSDILAGIDAVEKQAPIDDARLGIAGHSYGGYMTMWTVTHSGRFKAAMAGAGIADWVAYYGQNGIDQWMIPFFGASAYDDPRTYDRLSPIRYIRDAKTPTLIYVGERDVECPPAQSLEFWHGLRAMNVPTQLVIYPDEGHALHAPEVLLDRSTRMLGWFDKYLGVSR